MVSKLDDLVVDYAVGGLDPGRSLIAASLTAMKPEVARELESLERAGASLLTGFSPIPLVPGGYERLRARIAAEDKVPLPSADPDLAALPEPLRGPAAAALKAEGWRIRAPGVRSLNLARRQPGNEGAVELLRVAPRWGIPQHTHTGEELTLILSGGYTDITGHYHPGDVAFGDPALRHNPIADPEIPCVCLVVTDAPVRFLGALGLLGRAVDWVKGRA